MVCLQETWISSGTDLSPYIIPGYHLISTPHYALSHGGLVIYFSEKWNYNIKTDDKFQNCRRNKLLKCVILIKNPNGK